MTRGSVDSADQQKQLPAAALHALFGNIANLNPPPSLPNQDMHCPPSFMPYDGAAPVMTQGYPMQNAHPQWVYPHPMYPMDAANAHKMPHGMYAAAPAICSAPKSTTLMHPRKKAADNEGPESRTLTIDINTVTGLFHLPLQKAAEKIGICVTSMKRVCRRLGIPQWPYVKPTKASRTKSCSPTSRSPTSHSPTNVASPASLSGEETKSSTPAFTAAHVAPAIIDTAATAPPVDFIDTEIKRNSCELTEALDFKRLSSGNDVAVNEMLLETAVKADPFFAEGGVEEVPIDFDFISTFIASDDEEEQL